MGPHEKHQLSIQKKKTTSKSIPTSSKTLDNNTKNTVKFRTYSFLKSVKYTMKIATDLHLIAVYQSLIRVSHS